ncbi:MAG: glycosyltransferase [bacterium]|nr:glycosyltransferase [bacterium]
MPFSSKKTRSKKKKSLLFFLPNLQAGGTERFVVTLLKHLNRSSFQISLCVLNTRDAVFLESLPKDVRLVDLKTERVRYALWRIIRLIWSQKPDVVFTNLSHLNLALAFLRPILPGKTSYIARESTVVSEHFSLSKYYGLWKWAYRKFYRNFDLVVSQSSYMQNDLLSNFNFPKDKSIVINNPIEKTVTPISYDKVKIKNQEKDVNFLAIGRLSYEKGFDILLHAMKSLKSRGVKLTVLGSGPERNKLEGLAKKLEISDQVDFVGFQKDPSIWLRKADALVFSSRYDGFPNVLLESLLHQVPIIATPSPGGAKEIIQNIPECILAEKVSVEALSEAIEKWLNGSKKRVPESCIEPYLVSHIIPKYERMFLEAPSKGSK